MKLQKLKTVKELQLFLQDYKLNQIILLHIMISLMEVNLQQLQ